MPTLTARKRQSAPRKFARKDARTKVYAILYGTSTTKHDGATGPKGNPSRTHLPGFRATEAEGEFLHHLDRAQFTETLRAELMADLDRLKRAQRKERAQVEG